MSTSHGSVKRREVARLPPDLVQSLHRERLGVAGTALDGSRRQHEELPLRHVQRVDLRAVTLAQQSKDEYVGVVLTHTLVGAPVRIPPLRSAHAERDPRGSSLRPGLDERCRPNLDPNARWQAKVAVRPGIADSEIEAKRRSDDELGERTTRGVAEEIGVRPAPEVDDASRKGTPPVMDRLIACSTRDDRPQSLGSFSHGTVLVQKVARTTHGRWRRRGTCHR